PRSSAPATRSTPTRPRPAPPSPRGTRSAATATGTPSSPASRTPTSSVACASTSRPGGRSPGPPPPRTSRRRTGRTTRPCSAPAAVGFPYPAVWAGAPSDSTNPGASAITPRVLGPARPGSIILLHVQGQTAAALPAILSGLRARGLQQSTLPELFHAAGWQ